MCIRDRSNSEGSLHFFYKLQRYIKYSVFSFFESLTFKYSNPNSEQVSKTIESTFAQTKGSICKFGGWAIGETPFREFLKTLNTENNKIIEFGSGQSTLFLDKFNDNEGQADVTSIESDVSWFQEVKEKTNNINISRHNLRVISKKEFEQINNSNDPFRTFKESGKILNQNEHSTSETKGSLVFYLSLIHI